VRIQFKKGVLELCVLALLEKQDRYGYDIASAFSDEMEISDGTVYPILRRLSSELYLSSYLSESNEGPPRKYYTITPQGRRFLTELREEWQNFTRAVDNMLHEEVDAND